MGSTIKSYLAVLVKPMEKSVSSSWWSTAHQTMSWCAARRAATQGPHLGRFHSESGCTPPWLLVLATSGFGSDTHEKNTGRPFAQTYLPLALIFVYTQAVSHDLPLME